MSKSETRKMIKNQKGIIESSHLRTNCKNCHYHGATSKICHIHLLKTMNTEVCADFNHQRKAILYTGGAASPR